MRKHVPGSLDFTITETGIVFDKQGNVKNTYKNGSGYITVAIKLENGDWQTFGVHRLIALAYIPCQETDEKMTVNHIDGNIEHNHVSNLEWLTVEMNNIHAAMLSGTVDYPTVLLKSLDGVLKVVPNLRTASEMLKVSLVEVWNAFKNQSLVNDWYVFKYSKQSLQPEGLKKRSLPIGLIGKMPTRSINVFDIETEEIWSFVSILAAARHFETKANNVFNCISTKEKVRLFKQRYLVVDDGQPIPYLSPELKEKLIAIAGREVIAYNVKENYIRRYKSAKEFLRQTDISRKSVTSNLRIKRLFQTGDWFYSYATDEGCKAIDELAVIRNRGLLK